MNHYSDHEGMFSNENTKKKLTFMSKISDQMSGSITSNQHQAIKQAFGFMRQKQDEASLSHSNAAE